MKLIGPRFRGSRCPALAALIATLLGVGLNPAVGLAAESRVATLAQQIGIDQRLDAQVSLELKFRDETGQQVRLGDYFGEKPVVLTLVYYQCPMLCNQVLNGLLRASQGVEYAIGEDYDIVTVSFDPRETSDLAAEKKKSYVRSYRRPGARSGWHFLTGEQYAIEQLAREVGFRYQFDPRSQQYAHSSGIMILTPRGRVSRYLYGIEYSPNDLRLALVESSENRIGSPVDAFLLLCYHYDPVTGQYGFAIDLALKAAGVVTVLILGGFLWLMVRRERRLARQTVNAPSLVGQGLGAGS